MKTPCPRCNSPQSFKPRSFVDKGCNEARIKIVCTMCRWEAVLFAGTPEQMKLKKDIDRLRGKALRGDPVGSVLQKRQERLRDSQ